MYSDLVKCWCQSGYFLDIRCEKRDDKCALGGWNVEELGYICGRIPDDTVTRWYVHGMSLRRSKECCWVKVIPFRVLLAWIFRVKTETSTYIWPWRFGCLINLFFWDQSVSSFYVSCMLLVLSFCTAETLYKHKKVIIMYSFTQLLYLTLGQINSQKLKVKRNVEKITHKR